MTQQTTQHTSAWVAFTYASFIGAAKTQSRLV